MMINIVTFLWYKSVENARKRDPTLYLFMFEITIKIYTIVPGAVRKNDGCYRKGRGRGSESNDRNYHKHK